MKNSSILGQLLSDTWNDPDTGSPVRLPIRSIVIDRGVIENADEYLAKLAIGKSLLIVCDKNTFAAAGEKLFKVLERKYQVTAFMSDGNPVCDEATAGAIEQKSKDYDGIVAVGSGTINDLCKYASYKARKPYVVFATAPSMNGYCSASASIIVDNFKSSLTANPPLAVFMDIDVMMKAPARLIRSGLGDMLCRPTAQSDWLLSHLLLGTPYKTAPFVLLEKYENPLMENAKGLMGGDAEVMQLLCLCLVLSGIGMFISGGSYPASQGEHLIAHFMEMLFPSTSFHGEQIGITTLAMAAVQEDMLSAPSLKLTHIPLDEEKLLQYFGEQVGKGSIAEAKKKWPSPQKIDELNDMLAKDWKDIVGKISAVGIPKQKLKSYLEAAGCSTDAAHIGWEPEWYHQAIMHSLFLRNRFTFLDLAYFSVE